MIYLHELLFRSETLNSKYSNSIQWTLGREVLIQDLAGTTRCVLGTKPFLSQCPSPPGSIDE